MGGPNLILLILRILLYPNLSHISQWSKFPDGGMKLERGRGGRRWMSVAVVGGCSGKVEGRGGGDNDAAGMEEGGRGGGGKVCGGVLWSYGGGVLDRSIHRPQRAVWPVGRPHALEVPAA